MLKVVDHGVLLADAGNVERHGGGVVGGNVGGQAVDACVFGKGVGVENLSGHEVDGEEDAVEVGQYLVVFYEREPFDDGAAVELGFVVLGVA